MFPIWFILGIVIILFGIFNRQIMERFGLKPNSEVFTTPSRTHIAKIIEQIAQWLVIILGVSFLVLGFGEALPADISQKMLFGLLSLAGVMLVAIIGITVANWKAR